MFRARAARRLTLEIEDRSVGHGEGLDVEVGALGGLRAEVRGKAKESGGRAAGRSEAVTTHSATSSKVLMVY
jgi:hypothetical protein